VLAGFRGRFLMLHAAIFAAQGIAILLLWREPGSDEQFEYVLDARRRRSALVLALELLLAILLSIGGALAALRGGVLVGRQWELPGNAMIGALLLAPALVLPMVGSSALVAQRGQYSSAISSLVAVALLNMCLLLPLVIATWSVAHVAPPQPNALQIAMAACKDAVDPALSYAASTWRVDATLLLVIGFWLLPIAAGRWIPSRAEGAGLVVAYAAYLTMTAYANTRW